MVGPQSIPEIRSLREVELLKPFSDSELGELLSSGSSISCDPYSNIIIEGELSWGMYFILEGSVGVSKASEHSGNTYDVGHLKAGSFFGEMSLLDDAPRSATVRALTKVRLFYLSKDAFYSFLGRRPQRKVVFYESCTKLLVRRLRTLGDNYVVSQFLLWKQALKNGREAA